DRQDTSPDLLVFVKVCQRICNLPPETGPCKVYFSRHFYNTTSGKCEIFIYGCCQGNLNRFKSLRTCIHQSPSLFTCRGVKIHKLFYNPHSHRCEPFIYGDCEGNANRFPSAKDKCVLTYFVNKLTFVVCHLPTERGLYEVYIQHFYYNHETKKCEEFVYGEKECMKKYKKVYIQKISIYKKKKKVIKEKCNCNCQ
uniref:BPTI/Kunitz inhibitor domain-containing protein n=1 Tax=Periophthalmus magnuspinnatus TaxID=409849 RepID=A0A3B4BIU2_9GOBI